ncbi:unnamed protein product [Chrysoparadoxa australica]
MVNEAMAPIVEIREFIDGGSAGKSEVIEIGEVLRAAPDVSGQLAQNGSGRVQAQHEGQHYQELNISEAEELAKEEALKACFDRLMAEESREGEEEKERKEKKGITGSSWGKGFLSKPSKKRANPRKSKAAASGAGAGPAAALTPVISAACGGEGMVEKQPPLAAGKDEALSGGQETMERPAPGGIDIGIGRRVDGDGDGDGDGEGKGVAEGRVIERINGIKAHHGSDGEPMSEVKVGGGTSISKGEEICLRQPRVSRFKARRQASASS